MIFKKKQKKILKCNKKNDNIKSLVMERYKILQVKLYFYLVYVYWYQYMLFNFKSLSLILRIMRFFFYRKSDIM